MSLGSFILGGIGGGSRIALVVTEGFGAAVSAPVSAVLGGIPKRRGAKRYEIKINDRLFVAASIPALEAKVLRWRRDNPANEPTPIATPQAPQPVPFSREREVQPSGPERREIRGTQPAPGVAPLDRPSLAEIARGTEALARQAEETARLAQEDAMRRDLAVALALAQAEEEDDMEALLAILRAAA